MDTSQGHKILVLHADPIFGVLFQRMLARCNDEVRFISDGWQGLTVAQQEHPAIIFIYLWTPGLSAFEFYEHLHMTHPILDTRLVFYGGMPVERVYPQIRPLQVSGYLAQPFGIQELIRVRNTVLNGETYFQFGRTANFVRMPPNRMRCGEAVYSPCPPRRDPHGVQRADSGPLRESDAPSTNNF